MAVDEKIKRELRVLNAYPISIDYVSGTNMVPIEFFLKDVVLPYGASAKIFVRKPSGAVVFENCTLDMETNSIEVVPTAQMFAEAGESVAQIQIIDSQDLINSYPITFNVYPMLPEDEAVVSTNEFGAFQTLLNSAPGRCAGYTGPASRHQPDGLPVHAGAFFAADRTGGREHAGLV